MFDAWANNLNDWSVSGIDQQAIARFNHLPGGSNVLYMDGHVEFVRFPTKYPVFSAKYNPALKNGDGLAANLMNQFGGLG